jgi:hypothetical protein
MFRHVVKAAENCNDGELIAMLEGRATGGMEMAEAMVACVWHLGGEDGPFTHVLRLWKVWIQHHLHETRKDWAGSPPGFKPLIRMSQRIQLQRPMPGSWDLAEALELFQDFLPQFAKANLALAVHFLMDVDCMNLLNASGGVHRSQLTLKLWATLVIDYGKHPKAMSALIRKHKDPGILRAAFEGANNGLWMSGLDFPELSKRAGLDSGNWARFWDGLVNEAHRDPASCVRPLQALLVSRDMGVVSVWETTEPFMPDFDQIRFLIEECKSMDELTDSIELLKIWLGKRGNKHT